MNPDGSCSSRNRRLWELLPFVVRCRWNQAKCIVGKRSLGIRVSRTRRGRCLLLPYSHVKKTGAETQAFKKRFM